MRNRVMLRPFDDVSFLNVSIELILSYKPFHKSGTYIEYQKVGPSMRNRVRV